MSPMRAAALFLTLLLLCAPPGRCLGEAKPWTGGFFVESGGYAEPSFLPPASCLGAGLFLEPLALRALNPALFAGVLFPVAPCQADVVALRAGLAMTLFDARLSWLQRTFYAALAWSPAFGAGLLYRPDGSSLRFALAASPLRLRAGDAVFTLCSPELLLDDRGSPRGWGLVLLQAALFLF
jgi:hypothetical protein